MFSLLLLSFATALYAQELTLDQTQVSFPLGSTGSMGLGSPNGEFTVAQDDLRVKVPGGYLRVNRDFDGTQWVFNRQWSGLGRPSFYQSSYVSMGANFTCTTIDGISTCDGTATTSVQLAPPVYGSASQTRIPSDPGFGRDAQGNALPSTDSVETLARKGIAFLRGNDGAYANSKFPRFIVRPQTVATLPPSVGVDSHPREGKPGQGGVQTTQVNGFRWIDRAGEWIEYDNFGRISSYGDRNNVRVWFQYGAHGQIERVLDDNGRTVFTFIYTPDGTFITQARDHTPEDGSVRVVAYQYDAKGRLHVVTNSRGHATTFRYGDGENERRIVNVTDAEGRITAVSYGATGRIASVTAPDSGVTDIDYGYDKLRKEFSTTIKRPQTASGRRVEVSKYGSTGRLASLEVNGSLLFTTSGDARSTTTNDQTGSSTTIAEDIFGLVTRETNADGTFSSYAYSGAFLGLTEKVDAAGIVTRLAYDSRGNLTRLTDAAGTPEAQITEYEVNERGETLVLRRKGGANPDGTSDVDAEFRMGYDSNGNLATLTNGEGKRWSYEYDNQGNVTVASDPLGHRWTYSYDAAGNRLSQVDPNGNIKTFSYDRTDLPVATTDALGHVVRTEYDRAGRKAKSVNALGAASITEYDAAGQVIAQVDAAGQRTVFEYDNHGRLIKTVDGEGNATLQEYVANVGVESGGELVAKIRFPAFERRFVYDSRKNISQQIDVVDGQSHASGMSYDAHSDLVRLTNPYGATHSTRRDGFRRPVELNNAIGSAIRSAYDHRNNLISVSDGLGHTRRMEFDRSDKLIKEADALGQATHYSYDDAGRVTQILRPTGAKVQFTYDRGGRLERRLLIRPDGSVDRTDIYSWDDGGRLTGWDSGFARSTRTYDAANRLLREVILQDGVELVRAYTYYANDQVKTYTGPDGVELTYTYDGNGELARVEIPGQGTISVVERQWLSAKKVLLPGGTSREIELDGAQRPTRVRVKGPGQSILFEQETVYGALGEATSRSTQGKRINYEYDAIQRLTTADSASGGRDEVFELDALGNRLGNGSQGRWTYDAANRLLEAGSARYSYDLDGNRISKVDSDLTEPQRTTRYSYDANNQLVEVRNGFGVVVARYAYDPLGYRISKEVTAAAGEQAGTIGKVLFLQAGEGLLAEASASGSIVRSYGWEPRRTYATDPMFMRAGGDYFYFHNDPAGMPWLLTNKAGDVVWAADQIGAYGSVESSLGSTVTQPWRFPGQYYDAELGLHYNYFRHYDPQTARYLQSDPIGLKGGTNTYLYASANPISWIDPEGLSSEPVFDTSTCAGNLGVNLCNGAGEIGAYNCDKTCTRGCTQKHENEHRRYLTQKYGRVCKGRPRGAVPYPQYMQQYLDEHNDWHPQYLLDNAETECLAHKISKDCLDALKRTQAGSCRPCLNSIESGLRTSKERREYYSCARRGW